MEIHSEGSEPPAREIKEILHLERVVIVVLIILGIGVVPGFLTPSLDLLEFSTMDNFKILQMCSLLQGVVDGYS